MADEERPSLWTELGDGPGLKRLRLVLKFWAAGFAIAALMSWTAIFLAFFTASDLRDIRLFIAVAIGATVAGIACWRIAFR